MSCYNYRVDAELTTASLMLVSMVFLESQNSNPRVRPADSVCSFLPVIFVLMDARRARFVTRSSLIFMGELAMALEFVLAVASALGPSFLTGPLILAILFIISRRARLKERSVPTLL
jgi:hypothetical protein